MNERTCLLCGKQFIAKYKNRNYCTDKCRNKYYYLKTKTKPVYNRITLNLVCYNCKKEYIGKKRDHYKHHFCGRVCFNEYRRNNGKEFKPYRLREIGNNAEDDISIRIKQIVEEDRANPLHGKIICIHGCGVIYTCSCTINDPNCMYDNRVHYGVCAEHMESPRFAHRHNSKENPYEKVKHKKYRKVG